MLGGWDWSGGREVDRFYTRFGGLSVGEVQEERKGGLQEDLLEFLFESWAQDGGRARAEVR